MMRPKCLGWRSENRHKKLALNAKLIVEPLALAQEDLGGLILQDDFEQ